MANPNDHPLNRTALEILQHRHADLVGLWTLPVLALATAGVDEDDSETLEHLAYLAQMPHRTMALLDGMEPEDLTEDTNPEAVTGVILSYLMPDRRSW